MNNGKPEPEIGEHQHQVLLQ